MSEQLRDQSQTATAFCPACGGTGRVKATLAIPEIPRLGKAMARCSFGDKCHKPATNYNPDRWGANGCHWGFCDVHAIRDDFGNLKDGYRSIPDDMERVPR